MKKETKLWVNQADEHYQDAKYLYQGGRYSACVYFCHQALEKILKACVVEFKDKLPEKIHQLDRIAREVGLKLPADWEKI